MGVIFRNGFPFGSAKDDVTVVTTYQDLEDLSIKEINHLYIVSATNQAYYYDNVNDEFIPVGAPPTNIPGAEDQLVAADGQNHAKANIGQFFSKYDNQNSESVLQTPSSAIKIKSTANNSESYWGNIHGLSFNMKGVPLVQFNGNDINGSPVLSMSGDGIIDVQGGTPYASAETVAKRGTTSDNWLSLEAGEYYSKVDSPFDQTKKMSADGRVYPLLQFKDSSTILMEGSSIAHLSGGASVFMDGNADVRIMGSFVNHGSEETNRGRTVISIDPGSAIIMSGDENYTPHLAMTYEEKSGGQKEGQIILTCQKATTFTTPFNPQINSTKSVMELSFQAIAQDIGITSGFSHQAASDLKFAYTKGTIYKPSGQTYLDKSISWIEQPTIGIQGPTNIIIGDSGKMGVRMLTSGQLGILWAENGDTGISITSEATSMQRWDFHCGHQATQRILFKTCNASNTLLDIEFSGSTSIDFNPISVFGFNASPRYTDILYQWDKLIAIIEGEDTFIQQEGNGHFEFLDDSTIIMRGPDIRNGNKSGDSAGRGYDIGTNGPTVTITTSSDYTGQSYNDFTSNEKQQVDQLLCPSFSQTGKKYYSGGNVVSTFAQEDAYTIKINGCSKDYPGTSSTTVWKFYLTIRYNTYDALVASQDFQNILASTFGSSASITNGAYASNPTSSGMRYLYYIRGTIVNAEASFNSATQYTLNTSYDNLSAADQTKVTAQGYTVTNGVVISNNVRSDIQYNTTLSGYKYIYNTHLFRNWALPVQAETGPISQMYDLSNFCMRGTLEETEYLLGNLANLSETYDFSESQYEIVNQFINSADYTTFVNSLNLQDKIVAEIISVRSDGQSGINIRYRTQWAGYTPYAEQKELSPVFEMVGPSELRITGGASIKAKTQYDQTFITFSGTAVEGEVTFTIDELRDLKSFISTI